MNLISANMKKRNYLFRITFLTIFSCFANLYADVKTSIQSISSALFNIDTRYVEEVNIDSLTEVAIRAVLGQLDPHTNYMSAPEYKEFREGLGGGFEGIGVSFRMVHDTIMVIHPVVDGPSETAGIKPGDLIVSCNDSILAGKRLTNDAIKKTLRGPRGSIAHLGIKRKGIGDLLYFDVKRDNIPVLSVPTYYMANETVGYIQVDRFAQKTAEEVSVAMESLKKQGMKDLIIDLQSNGGGFLNSAVEMASHFLPGLSTVVYTEGRNEERDHHKTSYFSSPFEGKLIVLIDEQSASASEIFAGAVQDYDRGLIIGRRSFGKGLVQRPVDLPNGGMIRMTVSHYYTPSGRCIQKPYTKGDSKSYNEDILNRMHNGELVSADSIHLVDSLKYYTKAGRVVYGGGGIMPDVFVPMDTTRMTPAHRAVLRKTSMLDYTIDYFRAHHESIIEQYPTLDAFADKDHGFNITDDIVKGVIDRAKQDSVEAEGLDSLVYNDIFRTQVLAYLANQLYDNGGYKRIINNSSKTYLDAIDLLADEKRYYELLAPQNK